MNATDHVGFAVLLALASGASCARNDVANDAADTASGGAGNEAATGETPWTGGSLKSRIETVQIQLPQAVEAATQNYCIWGGCALSPRLYHAPIADGRTFVGWSDGSGNGHVSVVSGSSLEKTFDFAATPVRGLVAHDDSTFSVLLWSRETPARMLLSKRDANGNELWTADLYSGSSVPVFARIGDSRLAYGGGRYAAYFSVQGTTSHSGHDGDQLTYVGDDGSLVGGGWNWGCSHSLAQIVGYHPALNGFMALCSSDCYPAKGIVANADKLLYEAGGDCAGNVSAQLGQAAAGVSSWKVVFGAMDRPCCKGQGVAFATMDAQGNGSYKWLTDTDGTDQLDPAIARLGVGAANERYLIGWRTGSNPKTYWLGVVDESGEFVAAWEEVTSANVWWGRRDDSFRTRADGSVSWVAAAQKTDTLYLFRFDAN